MPIKTKININLDKSLKETKKRFSKDLSKRITAVIEQTILKRSSPVEGWGRFQKYSKKYAKRKGVSRSQVDMTDTGKMLNSLKAVAKQDGSVEIQFTDKKARYHNDGKGNLPARRLLPTTSGESFTKKITNFIIDVLKRSVKKEF